MTIRPLITCAMGAGGEHLWHVVIADIANLICGDLRDKRSRLPLYAGYS